jgi:hypothetical protein
LQIRPTPLFSPRANFFLFLHLCVLYCASCTEFSFNTFASGAPLSKMWGTFGFRRKGEENGILSRIPARKGTFVHQHAFSRIMRFFGNARNIWEWIERKKKKNQTRDVFLESLLMRSGNIWNKALKKREWTANFLYRYWHELVLNDQLWFQFIKYSWRILF